MCQLPGSVISSLDVSGFCGDYARAITCAPLRDHPIINPRNKDQRQFPINLGCIPGDRDAFLEKVLNHENVPLPVDVSQKEEGEIIIKIKR